MELTTRQVELRTLTASEGMYLTQSGAVSDRVYVKTLHLGQGEVVENWREATEEEKIAHEAKVKAELEAMVSTETEE